MREFKTAHDFRTSLESRLQSYARAEEIDYQRVRTKVAFDRFLARIFFRSDSPFVLKGGYAMELRLRQARATRDIDLTCLLRSSSSPILEEKQISKVLREVSSIDLGDYFSFQVGAPKRELDGPPYGGSRYPVTALVGGRVFERFSLDVGGDLILDEIEEVNATDWLSHCQIAAPRIPMISVEQQLAEKFHAYTLPRQNRENTRVKDLVDFVLFEQYRQIDVDRLALAVSTVFRRRATHPQPQELSLPPPAWEKMFEGYAEECGLSNSLSEAFGRFSSLYQKAVAQVLSK